MQRMLFILILRLAALFEKAVKEQWLPNRFKAGLQNTKWYRDNSEYARETFR
jgi:hypothetical protein